MTVAVLNPEIINTGRDISFSHHYKEKNSDLEGLQRLKTKNSSLPKLNTYGVTSLADPAVLISNNKNNIVKNVHPHMIPVTHEILSPVVGGNSPVFNGFLKRHSDTFHIPNNSPPRTSPRNSVFARPPNMSPPLFDSPNSYAPLSPSPTNSIGDFIGMRQSLSNPASQNTSPIFNHPPSRTNLLSLVEKELHVNNISFVNEPSKSSHSDYKSSATGTFSGMMFASPSSDLPTTSFTSAADLLNIHPTNSMISSTNTDHAEPISFLSVPSNMGNLQNPLLNKIEETNTGNSSGNHSSISDEYKNDQNVYKDQNQKKIKSVSSSFNKDNKRLVNQFLGSLQQSQNIPLDDISELNCLSPFSFLNRQHISLEMCTNQNATLTDILRSDLGTYDNHKSKNSKGDKSPSNRSPFPPKSPLLSDSSPVPISATSSRNLSSEYSSSNSSSSSSVSSMIGLAKDESLHRVFGNPIESKSNPFFHSHQPIIQSNKLIVPFAIDELNSSKAHIELQLATFEKLLKCNFQKISLSDETALQQSLADFDIAKAKLDDAKREITTLKDTLTNKYIIAIDKKFDTNDEKSYASKIQREMDFQVTALSALELRMQNCGNRLNKQKEMMKKFDELLQNETFIDKLHDKNIRKIIYVNRTIDLITAIILFYVIYWLIRWLR